ncbi:MAG: peptidoglycan editing factor PgeF [Candidatus Dadabacteria bacterium]|nr:peptidoglycan editing factor PgeF [Candidatus Dadabacteria bacterium]
MRKINNNVFWIEADWPVPEWVNAGTTLRTGGISESPFNTFNLAQHVGDKEEDVFRNRKHLRDRLKLLSEPCWLKQVHENRIINANKNKLIETADGSFTSESNTICVVLTADCLPLLLYDADGQSVAAIHIGWRGLSQNIIANALVNLSTERKNIIAWIGPCISADHYEIDKTVFNAINTLFTGAEEYFTETRKGHWMMDLKQLVRKQLLTLGINHIYVSPYCTFSDKIHFYSHRRDGLTGRMASLIWMDSHTNLD